MGVMQKKKRVFVRFLKRSGLKNILLFSCGLAIILASFLTLWISTFQLPTLDSFKDRTVSQSTKIYDRTGEVLLYDVYQNVRRTIVPFEQMSQHVKDATISIEDKDFYNHSGVKFSSFVRALFTNIQTGKFSQGGSTITQQVVKNSLLTGEKSITRKVKEWVLSIKLEKILSKNEILGMYLNEIPYGGSVYGIEEAGHTFFGKKASELTIAESAYLASLPKAPTFYSPYKNRKGLDERKNLVLKEMLADKHITQKEYDDAKKEVVVFKDQQTGGIKAPHFVMFVKDLLEKKYGEQVLEEGGLKIITTINYEVQQMLEKEAKDYALTNDKTHDASNIAVVALDPKTGQILAMIGSRNYFDTEIDGNFNVALAHRQPGSAFKPFAYAEAFLKGYTPDTVLFDVKTQFSTACAPDDFRVEDNDNCYSPNNYDNKFRGPMTMRNALAQSINIPAIKTLYLSGMGDVLRLAKDMGITSLTNANQYGLTLVLGGGEVSLLDMTSAYGVFANGGVRIPYQSILEIQKKDGTLIEKPVGTPTVVLSENVTAQISDILSSDTARAPIFGVHSPLYVASRDVAVKTGTTNDYKDAWIIGYTPSLVVGAWVGNNNNTPMKKVAGYIIAPFWNKVMTTMLKKYPDEQFRQPDQEDLSDLKPILRGGWQGDDGYVIDKISGKLATEYTPSETRQGVLTGKVHSILYFVDKNNPRGPRPVNPSDDPQYERWNLSVQQWIMQNNIQEVSPNSAPKDYDNVHTLETVPKISIISPQKDAVYSDDKKITTAISFSSRYPSTKVEYYLNENFVGESVQSPFTISFTPNSLPFTQNGQNDLRAVIFDSVFNKNEAGVSFQIQ